MGFNWNDSPVKKVAEDIRDNGEKPLLTQDTQQEEKSVVVAENGKEVKSEKKSTTEPTNEGTVDNEKNEAKEENEVAETKVANTSAPVAKERKRKKTLTDTSLAVKGKTENGIVVNVPMEDYIQLTMLKFQTGRTLKDLALQAIHEFVERNK
jgi:hypothetical protein